MLFDARHAAAVIAETVADTWVGRNIVAIQQIGFAVINADVSLAGGLSIVSAHRSVTVDRIELVRLDIAEYPLTCGLAPVIGQGEQIFALDSAFQQQSSMTAGIKIASRTRPEKAQLAFKSII